MLYVLSVWQEEQQEMAAGRGARRLGEMGILRATHAPW